MATTHGKSMPSPMYLSHCLDEHSVQVEAMERAYRNRFSATNDPLVGKADQKNICAQRAVLDMLGQTHDLIPQKKTRGWDFVIGGKKIKVMGAQEGGNLLIKQRKTRGWYADIYILCWIIDGNAYVMRWCEGQAVIDAPVILAKKDGKYTSPAHQVQYSRMINSLGGLKVSLGLAYGQEGFTW